MWILFLLLLVILFLIHLPLLLLFIPLPNLCFILTPYAHPELHSPSPAPPLPPLAGRNTAQSSPRRKADPQRVRKLPPSDAQGCFIPYEEPSLPPICVTRGEGGDVEYKEVRNDADLLDRLQRDTLKFIIKNNFYVLVKVVNSK